MVELEIFMSIHYCNQGPLVAISLDLYADLSDFEVHPQRVFGTSLILRGIDIRPSTGCESLDMQTSPSDDTKSIPAHDKCRR